MNESVNKFYYLEQEIVVLDVVVGHPHRQCLSQHHIEKEQHEGLLISCSHAITYPSITSIISQRPIIARIELNLRAMMVHFQDTLLTSSAVMSAIRLNQLASSTKHYASLRQCTGNVCSSLHRDPSHQYDATRMNLLETTHTIDLLGMPGSVKTACE